MNLRVEQRALAQSDQDDVVVLGPSPADSSFSATSTEGAYKILGVRPGLTISVFDMVIGADFVGRFATEPCVAIDFLFEASGQGWLLGSDAEQRLSSIPYRPGRIYMMAAPQGSVGLYDVPVGTRFKGMDIRVDIGLWQKLGAGDLLANLDEHHALHMASGNGTWVGVLPVPPDLLAVARALFDSAMVDSDDLAFEARALDIINASIAAMRRTPPAQTVPPRDRRPLQRARDLLIAELARPWTLDDLAGEVGLTQKRLKCGFKSLYGFAVYAFLKEQRLLEARRVIESGEMNVTQAANAVGYSNPSHFSQLFLRRFGMQPSRVLALRSADEEFF
ncbi:helix-turn-helix transcriptional regulator [Shinella sp. PSBB067]|uniref:helix-turn-helix transcriptional regulator n=1 Tax=unclassified Shinella TaxID=2643062 RepID=UPI00193BD145|nr:MULTISPECIES: AraC family transcriptional regulator [unclassified Shinella]QRI62343.1 helix-turn-helix transcriptional regulator [Shinella sp. PSBB067]